MKKWILKQLKRAVKFIQNREDIILYFGGIKPFIKRSFLTIIFDGIEGYKRQIKDAIKFNDPNKLNQIYDLQKKKNFSVTQSVLDSSTPGYVIFAPDYTPTSAGITALYILCDELNKRGYPSFIYGSKITPTNLVTPTITEQEAKQLTKLGYFAVYPETVFGNPLNASKVARFVGNRPGLLGGDKIYSDEEVVFTYSDSYSSSIMNKIAGKLYIPLIDEKIFFDDGRHFNERSLQCYYVGKSTFKQGIFEENDVFEITRGEPKKKELGKIFRNSKVLFCFDNSTLLAYEAILCGCPVVIIPDGTAAKVDYENYELGNGGIAWGPEELSRAQANTKAVKERYDNEKEKLPYYIKNFIAKTHGASAK